MDTLDTLSTVEEKLCYKASLKKIPLSGGIELLPLCNMNCNMCYIKLTKEEMKLTGRVKEPKEWLSLAENMKESGTLFLLLTGGEPFLYKGFEELYLKLKEMGFIITINTNGTLINNKIANMLKKYKPRRVNVTLYGASNETYNRLCNNPNGFDETIRGIKLLIERGIDVKINISLVMENKGDLPEMLKTAHELGIHVDVDTYMYPVTKGIKNNFNKECRINPKEVAHIETYVKYNTETEANFIKNREDFLNLYEYTKSCEPDKIVKMKCRAGKSSFWIDWKGHMYPCVFMEKWNVDVFQQGFKKSWNYVVNVCENISLPKGCANCDKRGICQVCAACVYCENKNFEEVPKYLCEMTKEFIDILK